MLDRRAIVPCCCLAAMLACSPRGADDPQLILTGGVIYPLGASDEPVSALAIHGDSIMAVGSDAEILALAGDYTQQMDLDDNVVLPGFSDFWVDIEALGRWTASPLDLRVASTVEEAQAMVRNAAPETDSGGWLIGWGWDEYAWPVPELPTHAELDATGVQAPIVLYRASGPAAWLNSEALQRLAPEDLGEDPPGGRIVRDAAGNPTGVLIGRAIELVEAAMPPTAQEQRREWIAEGLRQAAAAGLTRVATEPIDPRSIDHYARLETAGLVPVRVDLRFAPEDLGDALASKSLRDELVRIAAAGIRVDGPIPARMAALSAPYADSDDRGLLLATDRELQTGADAARAAGLPFHLMVHGDRAFDVVADALAGSTNTAFVGLDLAPGAAAESGAFGQARVAIVPLRFAADVYWLERTLGPERAARAHGWHDLTAAGVPLGYASDAPSYPLRPLVAAATAITRQDPDGYPAGGWHVEQAVEQALLVRAMVGFGSRGTEPILHPGAPADLVIWSENPLEADAQGLQRAQAMMTIVAGRVAYSRPLVELPMRTERSR